MKKEFADEIEAQVRKDRQQNRIVFQSGFVLYPFRFVSFCLHCFDEKNILDITNHIVIGFTLWFVFDFG